MFNRPILNHTHSWDSLFQVVLKYRQLDRSVRDYLLGGVSWRQCEQIGDRELPPSKRNPSDDEAGEYNGWKDDDENPLGGCLKIALDS